MKLHELSPMPGSNTEAKRKGRGHGSGNGKTAGKGHKGQKARSGGSIRPGFEGGQTALARRIPKRGFKHAGVEFQIVNLKRLAGVSVTDFDAKVLFDQGFIKNVELPVKVLAFGSIDKAINVKVNAISEKAKAAIEAAGGKVEII